MDRALEAIDIESGYEGVQILWKASLAINKSASVVLLGPNGAGKTTLLRALVGILPAWHGRILMDGRDVTSWPTEKRVRAGLSFMSELGVFPTLSVLDNLRMGGYFLGREAVNRRIREMYELFPDLGRLRRSLAGTLSGGQRKMLGVAKALMSKPSILAMDEPSAGLSPKYVKEVLEILRLAREEKLSLLIAEQNILFLEQADYGFVLEGGRIVAQGTPKDLKQDDVVRRAYFGMLADAEEARGS